MPKNQAETELARRELARRHLLDFVTYNFPTYDASWHHKLIIEKLEAVERGECLRLMLFLPPRHGKSELGSIQMPAWYLGRNPGKEIINASYTADLAVDFGRKTRNLVGSVEFRNLFGTTLSEDSQAANKWNTDKKGSYIAVGVGGPITGRGADCFVANTQVETENGQRAIETLQVGERVLSYSHDRKALEYQPILATRRITKVAFATVTTSGGRSITGTINHPIFVPGRGYVKIQDLRVGDRVIVWQGHKVGDTEVHSVWQRIRTAVVRIYQASTTWTQRHVLLTGLFKAPSRDQKQTEMRGMWGTRLERDWRSILFEKMQTKFTSITRYSVHPMPYFVQTTQPSDEVLREGMQESLSRETDGGTGEFQLSTRDGVRQVSTGILSDTEGNTGSGQEMHGVRDNGETVRPSQGLQSEEQRSGQSDNSLYDMPHDSPLLTEDTISAITFINQGMDAYDIQVGGNENFFADGILAHNCLIIDDPFKNRQEADSPLVREQVWNWYTSTAYTRLSPKGAVILICTRWHDLDLAGRLLQAEKTGGDKWDVLSLPAIATQDEPPYRLKGEALWPTRFDLDRLQKTREVVGSYDWASLYQQNPIDEESVEFKKEWFKTRKQEEVDKLNVRRFLTVDTAGRMTDKSDYTALIDNCVDTEGMWNIKAMQYKMGPEALVEMIFALQQKYHYEKIGIEKTIYLDALKMFLDMEAMRRHVVLPIVELKHGGMSKQLRIRGLLPRYQYQRIFHIEGQCDDLIPQLVRFPKGGHDDLLDALAYQDQIAEAPFGWAPADFPQNDDGKPKSTSFDPFNPIAEI